MTPPPTKMSDAMKVLLLIQCLIAILMRCLTQSWRQTDWPHELSYLVEHRVWRRLSEAHHSTEAVANFMDTVRALAVAQDTMEAWAPGHVLDEWHCRVEDLIGCASPKAMLLKK